MYLYYSTLVGWIKGKVECILWFILVFLMVFCYTKITKKIVKGACILANESLSRRSKEETPSVKKTIKKGLSATQKTLAFIGSALGIITASITIMTFMSGGNKKVPEKPTKTTIVKEVHASTPSSVVSSESKESSVVSRESSVPTHSSVPSSSSSVASSVAVPSTSSSVETTPSSTEVSKTTTESSSAFIETTNN